MHTTSSAAFEFRVIFGVQRARKFVEISHLKQSCPHASVPTTRNFDIHGHVKFRGLARAAILFLGLVACAGLTELWILPARLRLEAFSCCACGVGLAQ